MTAHSRVLWTDAWVLAAFAVALLLRLVRLNAAPLWLDEVLTANWVALPAVDLVRTAVTDNHPPLYFLLLRGWTALAGDTPLALRLPSALFAAATVAPIAWLAASCVAAPGGERDALRARAAARWAAWFTALSPYLVHHGQEARMYALVTALAAVHLVLLVRFVRDAAARLGGGFVVAAWALAAIHYYAAFFVLGELAGLALALRRSPGRRRAALPAALLAALGALAFLVLAVVVARHQAGRQYGLGLAALPGALWSMLAGYTLLPSSAALHGSGLHAVWPYLPVAAGGGLALLVCAAYGWRAVAVPLRPILAVPLAVSAAVPLAAQLVADVGVNPRYLAAGMPAFLVWLGAGAPPRLARDLRSLAALVLLAVMALATGRHLADPGHGREAVDRAGEWLDARVPAAEAVLITSFEMDLVARYHWPERRLRPYPPAGVRADAANAGALAAELPFSGADRVYYVLGRAWVSDPAGALRRALRERYASCGGAEMRGIEILCLRAP